MSVIISAGKNSLQMISSKKRPARSSVVKCDVVGAIDTVLEEVSMIRSHASFPWVVVSSEVIYLCEPEPRTRHGVVDRLNFANAEWRHQLANGSFLSRLDALECEELMMSYLWKMNSYRRIWCIKIFNKEERSVHRDWKNVHFPKIKCISLIRWSHVISTLNGVMSDM